MSGPSAESDACVTSSVLALVVAVVLVMVFGDDVLRWIIGHIEAVQGLPQHLIDSAIVPFPDRPGPKW